MVDPIVSLPPLIQQPPGNNSSNPAGLPGLTNTAAVPTLPQTWTGLQTFDKGSIEFAGSTSGFTFLNASAIASGVLTLPAATDTLVGRNTVDTLTNKTLTNPIITGATISGTTLTGATITGATITTSTYNGNTWTAGTGTLTIAAGKTETFNSSLTFGGVDGKTLTINNSLTLAGTDGSTIAFGAGGTVAYQGATLAQFATTTSAQLASVLSDETGTGSAVFAISPVFTTPALGNATAVSINGNTISSGTGTLTLGAKTLTASNSLTLAGTDGTTQTFPSTSGNVVTSVSSNAVTNTMAAQMGAWTFKANNSGSTAAPTDITIDGLTAKASPAGADEIFLWDVAGAALRKATITSIATAGSVSSIAGNTGAFTLNNGITNSTNAIGLTVGQLPGLPGNTVASAGNIGELISSNVLVASMVSLTSGTAANITSITLTAGHWEISASVAIEGGSSTSVGNIFGGISPTSATMPTTVNGGAYFGSRQSGFTISAGQSSTCYPVGAMDVYLSTSTTYFLVVQVAFTVSTLGGYGFLRARRVQ